MKIVVVGGGSTYTPELVDGIGRLQDTLPVDELVLDRSCRGPAGARSVGLAGGCSSATTILAC